MAIQAGKGSAFRHVDKEKYDDTYNNIFKKKEVKVSNKKKPKAK